MHCGRKGCAGCQLIWYTIYITVHGQCIKLTFSSTKFKQPSRGTKAAIFFPFLISCTLTPLRIAELGCLASSPLLLMTKEEMRNKNLKERNIYNNTEFTYIFSNTIPLDMQDPPRGLAFMAERE